MSTTSIPIVTFASAEADLWGLLIGGEEPSLSVCAFNVSNREQPGDRDRDHDHDHEVTLELLGDSTWKLRAPTADLVIELDRFQTLTAGSSDQLRPCRVSGTVSAGGGRAELVAAGLALTQLPEGKLDSIRLIASWFPEGHEISLLAVRPKGAKGQAGDALQVGALGEPQPMIFDPRLSTTYGPDGTPRRTGIELWLGEDEDGDQHPRRVSGVSSGSGAEALAGRLQIQAQAMNCLSRGEQGTGVYLLMQAA